jgi:integrase/recombinase XerD
VIGEPWKQIWEEYEQHLRVMQHSEATLETKRWNIERFFSFLDSVGVKTIFEVDRSLLERFRQNRYEYVNKFGKQDGILSQAKYIETVRCFFAWAKRTGRIAQNPAVDFDLPRLPRRLPKQTLTHDEMKKLLESCDVSNAIGFRDRTILEFLYSTGLRLKEFGKLDLEDLDLDRGTVFVREGKGRKDRVVPVGKIAGVFLENYVKGVRPLFLAPWSGDALFLSSRGRRLSRNGLGAALEKSAKRAGVEKHVSTHALRRTFATALLVGGAKAAHVKDMLGHEGFQALSSYLNLTIRDLIEAHKKYHPRERDPGAGREEE